MTTTITLPHLPPHALHLTLLLSLSAATAARLRTALISHDPAFEYAFVDARTLLSRTHVLAGAFQALRNALVGGKVRTRNVHSEVVFCLGGNNNVGSFPFPFFRWR
jgi:EKC/KEOPS complex subunit CGI121/TPRKB